MRKLTLPVAVARSSSDDVAIRYVLPVLWMTSFFHTKANGSLCVFLSGYEHTTSITAEIATKYCSTY